MNGFKLTHVSQREADYGSQWVSNGASSEGQAFCSGRDAPCAGNKLKALDSSEFHLSVSRGNSPNTGIHMQILGRGLRDTVRDNILCPT